MTNRQIEELGKLYLDVGKLIIASLVLGFFQSNLSTQVIISYGLVGLTMAIGSIRMGLELFKEVK